MQATLIYENFDHYMRFDSPKAPTCNLNLLRILV